MKFEYRRLLGKEEIRSSLDLYIMDEGTFERLICFSDKCIFSFQDTEERRVALDKAGIAYELLEDRIYIVLDGKGIDFRRGSYVDWKYFH